jgi:hypothetical protein
MLSPVGRIGFRTLGAGGGGGGGGGSCESCEGSCEDLKGMSGSMLRSLSLLLEVGEGVVAIEVVFLGSPVSIGLMPNGCFDCISSLG